MKFGIGQSVSRVEDERFLTGRARYVDDLPDPDTLAVVIVRSTQAHALINSIDTESALAAPGVKHVLTGADYHADGIGGIACTTLFPNLHSNLNTFDAPAIAIDRGLYLGMAVALVVAENVAAALDAAELVEIDYESLAPVMTPAQALDAEPLWPDLAGNIAFDIKLGDREQTVSAIQGAAHVSRLELYNNRLSANSLETRGARAEYDSREDRVTLYTSTQVPHTVRAAVAGAVGLAQSQLRVIAHDVGGGFGMKGGLYPEDILLSWAVRRLRCKLAWQATRSESLLSDYHGRDQWVSAELAFDSEARICALSVQCDYNAGAYLSPGGGVSPMFASTLATGCYRVPVASVQSRAVYTNTSPTQPYRGAGRPEAAYLIERLIDKAAGELNIDRVELRRRNMLKSTEMPYKTPLLYTIDSGDYAAIVDRAIAAADWAGFEQRKASSRMHNKLRGIGIALHMENAGIANDSVELRLEADGAVTILAGTFSHGQGHETVYAQMVSEWLGVPFDSIRLVQGDTDAVSFGRGTIASRSMVNGGSSLRIAAEQVIEKAKAIAGHLMETAPQDIEFGNGELRVAGTDKSLPLKQIAAMSYKPMLPPELGIGLAGKGEFLLQGFTFPNGCQIVEVEIDPDTGVTDILSITSVDDVGNVINPMLLDGQLVGGIVQGLGQAVLENVVYDDFGQLLSGSFMDYAMPRAADIPSIKIEMNNTATGTNPLGVKGAGEAGTVGATPAIISAILNALAPLGVTDIAIPATPHTVWSAIQTANS
jgi:carbon-monoxide dehydrogenase large subunit